MHTLASPSAKARCSVHASSQSNAQLAAEEGSYT
jgi:hypothetical protein